MFRLKSRKMRQDATPYAIASAVLRKYRLMNGLRRTGIAALGIGAVILIGALTGASLNPFAWSTPGLFFFAYAVIFSIGFSAFCPLLRDSDELELADRHVELISFLMPEKWVNEMKQRARYEGRGLTVGNLSVLVRRERERLEREELQRKQDLLNKKSGHEANV